jgi:hypothetical protein
MACEPVTTPAPDRGACRAEAACHVGSRQALGQQQDHLGPETQVLRRLVRTEQRVERPALRLREGALQGAWDQT